VEQQWKDWTDEQLITAAQQGHSSQGAVVEMMRRLRDAIVALDSTTSKQQTVVIRLTKVLVWLTAIMLLAVLAQISLIFLK